MSRPDDMDTTVVAPLRVDGSLMDLLRGVSTWERPTRARIGLSVGPYRIIDRLGSGGMGVVYEVEHETTGARAALKTVAVPRVAYLASIRLEIEILASLSHPGVVRVLDSGTQAGLPWYVMHLHDGTSLRSIWRNVSRKSALTTIRHLCATLAFLHGEGIVHRDLKPENVLIASDGKPVLIDFGLLALMGREREPGRGRTREVLRTEGHGAGTLDYIAPEQLRGDPVDPRADLYSLGCVLYEFVAKTPPFSEVNTAEIITGRLNRTPAPIAVVAPEVSPRLAALIDGLVSPRPEDRPGSAREVEEVLEAEGAESEWARLPVRGFLYRSRLAGRDEAMRRLYRALTSAQDGAGSLMLVAGESGSGKTRIAQELVRAAQGEGFRLLVGECAELSTGPTELRRPLRLLGDLCRERGSRLSDRLFGDRIGPLRWLEPTLEHVAVGQADDSDAPNGPDLVDSLDGLLTTLSEIEPVLLVLDDLQWADGLTVDLLTQLLERGLNEKRLMVLGTYRLGNGNLDLLLSRPDVEQIELARLGDPSVRRIIQEMRTAADVPGDVIEFVVRHAEGNPFFVTEYLQAELDRRQSDRVRDDASLPTTLKRVIEDRLAALDPPSLALVRRAAVIGRDIDLELLRSSAQADGSPVQLPQLNELIRRRIIERTDDGRCRFLHHQLATVAYEGISPEARSALHRSVAVHLEEQLKARDDARLNELGTHWEQAGDRAKARDLLARAAEQAKQLSNWRQAIALYRRAADLSDTLDETKVELCSHVLHLLFDTQQVNEGIDFGSNVLAEVRQVGLEEAEARLLGHQGILLLYAGRPDEAAADLNAAVRIHKKLGNKQGQAAALGRLAIHDMLQGRVSDGEAKLKRVLQLARSINDRDREGSALYNLAIAAEQQERYLDAIELYEETRQVYEASGQPELRLLEIVGAVAFVRSCLGQIDEAWRLYQKARLGFIRLGELPNQIYYLIKMAKLARQQGNLATAERFLTDAEAILETSESNLDRIELLCERGHLLTATRTDATELLTEARALAETFGIDLETSPDVGLSVRHLDDAIAALESGHELLNGELPEHIPPLLLAALAI